MSNKIQVKRGVVASLPTLDSGEFGFCTDTQQVFIGTNATNYEVLMKHAFNATSFLYATSDNTPENKTPAEVLSILSGQANASFSLNNQKLTSVLDPTSSQDAATKAYVDSVAQGLNVHTAVACASTENVTLSGEQTIDGILTSTSRILLKDQTDASENGLYVTASGAWARASDMDANDEVASSFVFVTGGTVNSNTGWVCTNEPETVAIGTDNIVWSQFSDAGYIDAGTGLIKSGNQLSVDAELAAIVGLTSAANKIPYFTGSETAGLLDLVTSVGETGSDTSLVSEQGVREALNAFTTTFVGLTDTPADFTDDALKVLRVNTGADAVEFVNFASTYLEASPSNGETGKAPNSDWAFDHNAAATGVHGAGAETLLNTGSTIDGGSF